MGKNSDQANRGFGNNLNGSGNNICYVILEIEYAKSGQEIIISSQEKELMATTVDLPWFTRS